MGDFFIFCLRFCLISAMTAKQLTYQRAAASGTDRRITIINEFVQGIRVVKYYAWERPFLGVLDDARDQELVWLKKYNILKSITFGTLMLVPLVVSVVVFGIYAGTGGDMTPSVVFTAISLINVIRMVRHAYSLCMCASALSRTACD